MSEQDIPVIRTPEQARAHKAYLESLKSEQGKGIKVADNDDSVTIQDCYSISEQKDRPDRDKIAKIIFNIDPPLFVAWEQETDYVKGAAYIVADQIIPLIEEAKREERERIVSKMNRRDVGGINPEWALSDKDYQSLKGD